MILNLFYRKDARIFLDFLLVPRPGQLEAWLVLTSVKYQRNLYILIPLNQRLALTRLRATGPRMITEWNKLPKETVTRQSLPILKSKLLQVIFYQQFILVFICSFRFYYHLVYFQCFRVGVMSLVDVAFKTTFGFRSF